MAFLRPLVGSPPPTTNLFVGHSVHQVGSMLSNSCLTPLGAGSVEEFVDEGVEDGRARVNVDGIPILDTLYNPDWITKRTLIDATLLQFNKKVIEAGLLHCVLE